MSDKAVGLCRVHDSAVHLRARTTLPGHLHATLCDRLKPVATRTASCGLRGNLLSNASAQLHAVLTMLSWWLLSNTCNRNEQILGTQHPPAGNLGTWKHSYLCACVLLSGTIAWMSVTMECNRCHGNATCEPAQQAREYPRLHMPAHAAISLCISNNKHFGFVHAHFALSAALNHNTRHICSERILSCNRGLILCQGHWCLLQVQCKSQKLSLTSIQPPDQHPLACAPCI